MYMYIARIRHSVMLKALKHTVFSCKVCICICETVLIYETYIYSLVYKEVWYIAAGLT